MTRHLYMVGDEVTFGHLSEAATAKSGGSYTIKAQLPPVGDHLQYRIKSASEPHERVVVEHQLTSREPSMPQLLLKSGA